jgi:hypothetical protein
MSEKKRIEGADTSGKKHRSHTQNMIETKIEIIRHENKANLYLRTSENMFLHVV